MQKERLMKSLKMTLDWYRESGIMLPEDGSWGVAERVLLTEDNEVLETTYEGFPAWTPHGSYSILESRRADCNMEAAFLFLQLSEVFQDKQYYEIGHQILRFLYHRSALLKRFDNDPEHPAGTWNWSHQCWQAQVYFDDNAWVCALQLMIAEKYPELDAEFQMTDWALKLADRMAEAFPGYLSKHLGKTEEKPKTDWHGDSSQPHWGSLVCMALARAYRRKPEDKYRKAIDIFHSYLLENSDGFTASEFAYVLIGASMSFRAFQDELSWNVLKLYTGKMLAKMDPETGNLPAEHREAPKGARLADTIYTLNWALLGLHCANGVLEDSAAIQAEEKLKNLLLKIQDQTPEKHLYGAWRGMFDMDSGTWGGGNCFEGGANSIYSGWTNAPIPWVMADTLLGRTLLDY